MNDPVRRFEVYLVNLDPTRESEKEKTRPCLIISPDELNRHVRTVIVAPLIARGHPYPTRVALEFRKVRRQIVLDQIRTIDKSRLVKKLGSISKAAREKVTDGLLELFAA